MFTHFITTFLSIKKCFKNIRKVEAYSVTLKLKETIKWSIGNRPEKQMVTSSVLDKPLLQSKWKKPSHWLSGTGNSPARKKSWAWYVDKFNYARVQLLDYLDCYFSSNWMLHDIALRTIRLPNWKLATTRSEQTTKHGGQRLHPPTNRKKLSI